MNATQVQGGNQPVHQEIAFKRAITGSAVMEFIWAVATLVLAIAGLAGALSITLAAIATMIFGAAIWLEGRTCIASHGNGVPWRNRRAQIFKSNEGLGGEFVGGMSGMVLGILALLGIAPTTLLSIALLVFGAALLFNSGTGLVSRRQLLFGLAGLVLGLLAVCGLHSLTLVLVGLLCLGASALFNGAAVGFRMTTASHAK